MRQFIISLCVASLIVTNAHAQDQLGKELVLAFIGACMQTLPNLDRVEAAAKMSGWRAIEGDMAKMLAPANPDTPWKGWIVDQGPSPPFFLSISRGRMRGDEIAICSVANPHAPVEQVLPHLEKILGLKKPIADEISFGQRTRVWEVESHKSASVSLIDAGPTSTPGLSLAGMMKIGR